MNAQLYPMVVQGIEVFDPDLDSNVADDEVHAALMQRASSLGWLVWDVGHGKGRAIERLNWN